MTTAVILAAGTGSRFGGQKLLAEINGKPMLRHALDAVAHLPTVVVGAPELGAHAGAARFVENPNPDRGMSHSLRLANAAIEETDGLLVLLGDMPYMTRAIVDAVMAAAADSDVCYPKFAGIGGHPVYFSPAARAKIPQLADGDTLRRLRNDATLLRRAVTLREAGAYADIDTRADLAEAPTSSPLKVDDFTL